jgi:hypothetical protein
MSPYARIAAALIILALLLAGCAAFVNVIRVGSDATNQARPDAGTVEAPR